MKQETYKAAQTRLLAEFTSLGYVTKPNLKRPQVVLDNQRTLFFRSQAVYRNELSMHIDIRGMTAAQVLAKVW